MAKTDEDNNDELESFRRQWLEEVASRSKKPTQSQRPARTPADEGESSRTTGQPQYVPPPRQDVERDGGSEEQASAAAPPNFDRLAKEVRSMSIGAEFGEAPSSDSRPEPRSALEHFEQAARNEDEGNLGDSLELYRKAYKLDSKVDQTYRKKHFPPVSVQIPSANSSSKAFSSTVSNTALHSADGAPAVPTPDLITTFARLHIPGADPIIEHDTPPPCPISKVPSEVLAAILKQAALLDPASMPRVALVCRRLAFHVSRDQLIWRRLCQGAEFGFAAMHYSFACDVKGNRLHTLRPRYTPFPFGSAAIHEVPKPLMSWSHVFQAFPRIRFTGIYISTVNYSRTGTAAFQSSTWNSPIHIVTYYRYLRFYPDGTLISLLGTTKPVDVVPYISRENLDFVNDGVPAAPAHRIPHHQHHHVSPFASSADPTSQAVLANPVPPLAASALKKALRGRWHLAKPPTADEEPPDTNPSSLTEPPPPPPPSSLRSSNTASAAAAGPDPHDLYVETEGPDHKYTYTMHLALRSSGAGGSASTSSRNTKLVWKGYWSYNHLTDDWAEFGLRNDRPFVFRRVRDWGLAT